MLEKLKSLGSTLLGVAWILTMVIAVPLLFFMGAAWASRHLLGYLMVAGWVVLFVDVLILLPLSIVRRLRRHTGGLILMSSYLFGSVTWLFGFVVTYALWGGFAVVVGLAFFGVGILFVAGLASTVQAEWQLLATLVILAVVTYGSRLAGALILQSGVES